jgi:cytochrome c peroxidase
MIFFKHLPLAFLALLVFAMVGCQKDTSEKYKYTPTLVQASLPTWAHTNTIKYAEPVDNPSTKEGIALGKKLFYDKKLSANNTMSCSSCHQQANGFSDPDRFSVGIDGSKGNRNAMALINLGFSRHFFWDGREPSIEAQAHDPVSNPIEMNAKWTDVMYALQNDNMYPIMFYQAFGTGIIDSVLVTKAIAQFERTLISFNSKFDKYYYGGDSSQLNPSEIRGMNLFMGRANCFLCHNEPFFTNDEFINNGLDALIIGDIGLGGVTKDRMDLGKFKTPTLRNIAYTAPYMHDGRFSTLERVVDFYNSEVNEHSPNLNSHMNFPFVRNRNFLSAQEKTDLVSFLKALSDDEFLKNTNFKP